MWNRRGSLKYWLSAWVPVVLAVCVILIESTDAFSAEHTTGPFRWVWEALFGRVSNWRWNDIHFVLRKTGHFLGYGLIGLAWLRAWWMTLPHSRFAHDALLGLLGTSLIATADEWHQSFLPGRTSSVWDVLLDCSGALALQLIVYVYLRIFRPKRLVRE